MADISIDALLGKTDNIYEAVTIMAKRARQINDEQKAKIREQMEDLPETDGRDAEDFGEVEIDREALKRAHEKFPKPSRLALEELLHDDIRYEYTDDHEEGMTEEAKM